MTSGKARMENLEFRYASTDKIFCSCLRGQTRSRDGGAIDCWIMTRRQLGPQTPEKPGKCFSIWCWAATVWTVGLRPAARWLICNFVIGLPSVRGPPVSIPNKAITNNNTLHYCIVPPRDQHHVNVRAEDTAFVKWTFYITLAYYQRHGHGLGRGHSE